MSESVSPVDCQVPLGNSLGKETVSAPRGMDYEAPVAPPRGLRGEQTVVGVDGSFSV